MGKVLISWEAYREDFVTRILNNKTKRELEVLESGPTFSLHKDFDYDYDEHIVLHAPNNKEDEEHSELLVNKLRAKFPKHPIESRSIKIIDPLDVVELSEHAKVILSKYKGNEIEVCISTGAPNMRVAWFIAYPTFKTRMKLFQIKEARHSDHNKPEKVEVKIGELNPTLFNIFNEAISRNSSGIKIYYSSDLKSIYEKAWQISKVNKDVGCLILGESGTGKENLAKTIHDKSDRTGKFIPVNCATIPEELISSELFGSERGAFTGADKQKKGLFEEANGGTIFLDEIGDISQKMQVTLLRTLQEGNIRRVGGTKVLDIDVRVIAATNKDLEKMCDDGSFRWDLYFRLAHITLTLPSLRNWSTNDKLNLIEHCNESYLKDFPNREEKLRFDNDVIEILKRYHFKGNVRELQNLILSLYAIDVKIVTLNDLPERMKRQNRNPESLDEVIKAHIKKILTSKNWNISESAKHLDIARETLYGKIKKFQLEKPKN